jgi:SET domain-containing protein
MDEKLRDKLQLLLREHPELRMCKLDFSTENFSDTPNVSADSQSHICQVVAETPDLIRGHSPKVEVRRSPIHGYGIFAKEVIEEGELIEESKLLKLGLRANYLHDPTLKNYVWADKTCECEECKIHGAHQYLALGLGSLYNHSGEPNTRQNNNYRSEIMSIHARGRIEKDEEIFISYGKKYWLIRDFWKNLDKKKLEKYNRDNKASL